MITGLRCEKIDVWPGEILDAWRCGQTGSLNCDISSEVNQKLTQVTIASGNSTMPMRYVPVGYTTLLFCGFDIDQIF